MKKKAAKNLFKRYGVQILSWQREPFFAANLQTRTGRILTISTFGGKSKVEERLRDSKLHPIARKRKPYWVRHNAQRVAGASPMAG